MFTINDPGEQYAHLREKCCTGDGQIACLLNFNRGFFNLQTETNALSAENLNAYKHSPVVPNKFYGSEDGRKTTKHTLAPKTNATYLENLYD